MSLITGICYKNYSFIFVLGFMFYYMAKKGHLRIWSSFQSCLKSEISDLLLPELLSNNVRISLAITAKDKTCWKSKKKRKWKRAERETGNGEGGIIHILCLSPSSSLHLLKFIFVRMSVHILLISPTIYISI